MKRFYTILGVFLGVLIAASPIAHAAFVAITTPAGGTGTTTPSGILYGSNDQTQPLKTVNIGSNLTFSGGTLSATGGGGGGSGNVATSSTETTGQVPYWTTTGGTPAKLGSIATTTPTLSSPITYSGTLGSFLGGVAGAFGCTTASSGVGGCLSNTAFDTFNNKQTAGSYITALTGDVTASGPGSVAATLATVNSNVGTFTYPSVTVNGKGLITSISNGTAPTTYTGTNPIQVIGSVISSLFSTSTTWGLGNNGFVITGATGIPFTAASSTLNLPNTALQNSSLTVNGTSISLGGSGTVTSNTTNALTFNNSGSGASSGTTFNGGSAQTISYNTIGAQVAGNYSTSGYPFTVAGNATSTLTQFNGGLTAFGTSTIGAGAQTTGLTIFGGATTTLNAYFASNVGIGTTSPGSIFSIGGVGNFTTATSTFYGTGGLSLAGGCYAVNGVCLTAGAIGGGSTEAVNWATTAVLAGTPTYSNGTLGVGATLTEIGTGALSVDSNSPAAGDRVLVKNQASAFQNGIYTVTATGSGIASYILTRATDYNSSTEITPGINTYVISGTANSDSTWAVSFTPPLTLGTTNLSYSESAAGGTVTSIATNNGITGGTITTTGTIGLATINAGVLGAVTNSTIPTSQATSTLFGVGLAGQVLTYSGGAIWQTPTVYDSFAWPFTINAAGGVATSTLQNFTGGATTTALSALQAFFGSTASSTFTTGGLLGIGTSTPFAALTLDRKLGFASSTIAVNEYNFGAATSTAETIDCRSATDIHFGIGTSATTLTINSSSMIPGQKCIIIIENPNAAAGALTWAASSGAILRWPGGTIPTQTTTATKMDVWSFLMTQGSSTNELLGAQTANF